MMNYCFDNPCPNGFAFHKKYPGFQTAFSGSFRYVLYIQWSRGGNLGGKALGTRLVGWNNCHLI